MKISMALSGCSLSKKFRPLKYADGRSNDLAAWRRMSRRATNQLETAATGRSNQRRSEALNDIFDGQGPQVHHFLLYLAHVFARLDQLALHPNDHAQTGEVSD